MKKVSFTFGISIRKNKKWNAGEKPEEKSLRSTLTCFKGDYFFLKNSNFTIKCGEFYFNAICMVL